MPGILPMKVIKVGTSSQARIAQACDRCRSKKIRCDGIRPSCTQCTNVGFECKTSDKLSRRAFPRGYTESLEERVRGLETEARELKDLLDAKEEKIDMLARMHSHSPRLSSSSRRPSSIKSTPSAQETREALLHPPDDQFRVKQLPCLYDAENSDSFFAATSSSRFLLESFKRRLQEAGKPCPDVRTNLLFPTRPQRSATAPSAQRGQLWQAPPRVLSDQMVNIFFQEWAPLFPVLHRPTFLRLYEAYVSSAGAIQDKKSLAQLNLVFGIAALSSESRITYDVLACERQWVAALSTFSMETSLVNLQCLVLAQLYCLQKGDYTKVLHYRSLAVGIAYRLGLHQSQKRFALGVLTSETRKKVFWTLYTLDCFSAAALGLPQILKDDDVECEYPVDADDEYVTEKGFQPSLPGESTKLSSALALFRGSRILSKVLAELYPSTATHELSMGTTNDLDQELREWLDGLPSHLRLSFENEKPSTNVISSRCPLLSLAYHYIRTMIHRPAVCANIGPQASSSLDALASSSRNIIQIIQLLEERNLSFSMCVNKTELVMLSGFSTLFQIVELPQDSKLRVEYQKIVNDILKILVSRSCAGAIDFKQMAGSVVSSRDRCTPSTSSNSASPEAGNKQASDSRKVIRDIARRYAAAAMSSPRRDGTEDKLSTKSSSSKSSSAQRSPDKRFRPIAPSSSRPGSQTTQQSPRPKNSQASYSRCSTEYGGNSGPTGTPTLNLDYFSFGDEAGSPLIAAPMQEQLSSQENLAAGWEQLFSVTSNGDEANLADNDVYGWPPLDDLLTQATDEFFDKDPLTNTDWTNDAWHTGPIDRRHQTDSVLSISEDTLSSGDEFASIEMGPIDSEATFKVMATSGSSRTPKHAGMA